MSIVNEKRTVVAVLASGWVLVGVVADHREDGTIDFERAAVIRRWGTADKGIGALATGPLADTIVDPINAPTRAEGKSVLFSFDATGWSFP